MTPESLWFIAGILLLLGELWISLFVLIFFGMGACITAFAVMLQWAPHASGQWLIFVAASIASLLLFRGMLLRKRSGRSPASERADHIGSHAIVLVTIEPQHTTGRVELHGTVWHAVADERIAVGTEVVVTGQNNLVVTVKSCSF